MEEGMIGFVWNWEFDHVMICMRKIKLEVEIAMNEIFSIIWESDNER